RPSNNVPLLYRRIGDHCAGRKIEGSTSTSLPTAASCLSRAQPSQNNESTLLLLRAAVLRCRSACNRRAQAARRAILFHPTRDAFHPPRRSGTARPNIVDARIASLAACN